MASHPSARPQRMANLLPVWLCLPCSSSATLDQAVEGAIGRLDSPDVGLGVSWKELEHHLHSLLQV